MSLSTVIARVLEDTLDRERGTIPEVLTVPEVSRLFGVSQSAIHHAIKVGKLAAEPVEDSTGGVLAWHIPLAGAFAIWGHKLLNGRDTATDGEH